MSDCNSCTREKTVTLTTGKLACTWCADFAVDCEARFLLKMPLLDRQNALDKRDKIRGNTNDLRGAMMTIHARQKKREQNERQK
jgi:hypothetical protein